MRIHPKGFLTKTFHKRENNMLRLISLGIGGQGRSIEMGSLFSLIKLVKIKGGGRESNW